MYSPTGQLVFSSRSANSIVSILQRGRVTSRLRGNAMGQCTCACVHITHKNTHYISNSGGFRGKGNFVLQLSFNNFNCTLPATGRNQW